MWKNRIGIGSVICMVGTDTVTLHNKSASRRNPEALSISKKSFHLFLHKLQSTHNLLRLHIDEVHTIVQAFKIDCGHAFGLLTVYLLSQAVEHHNVAIFLRKIEAELAMVRVRIHRNHILAVLC